MNNQLGPSHLVAVDAMLTQPAQSRPFEFKIAHKHWLRRQAKRVCEAEGNRRDSLATAKKKVKADDLSDPSEGPL